MDHGIIYLIYNQTGIEMWEFPLKMECFKLEDDSKIEQRTQYINFLLSLYFKKYQYTLLSIEQWNMPSH